MEKEINSIQRSLEPIDYKWFKKLTKQQKYVLYNSKQEEIYRKPKPIDGLWFSQENFLELVVEETQSFLWNKTTTKIKLATYRERSALEIIRGVVILFHGLTSHTNQGVYIAKKLAVEGYDVVGYDQRGFGKSEGKRGYIESIEINIHDAELFIKKIKQSQSYKQLPIYLCGLSMGGLLCFNLGLKHPKQYAGLILMAPALRSYHGFGALLTTKFLSFLSSNLQLPKGKSGKHGSKNPNVSESRKGDNYRYTDDPYANTLKCVLDGMNESQKHFQQLDCKRLLLIQGAKDNSVNPDGIIDLFEKTKCKDKQILFYKNLWHNIWQQEQIYDIVPRIIQWLDKIPII